MDTGTQLFSACVGCKISTAFSFRMKSVSGGRTLNTTGLTKMWDSSCGHTCVWRDGKRILCKDKGGRGGGEAAFRVKGQLRCLEHLHRLGERLTGSVLVWVRGEVISLGNHFWVCE